MPGCRQNIMKKILIVSILAVTGCPAPSDATGEESTSANDATTSAGSTGEANGSTGIDPNQTTTSGSTTVEPDGSTTTPVGSSDSTGGSTEDSGPPPVGGYGDCANGGLDACEPFENCLIRDFIGVCAGGGCNDPAECPVPDLPGAPSVACADISGRGVNECVLECSSWADCPETMLCISFGTGTKICMWPTFPPGGGQCPDVDMDAVVPQTYMGNSIGLGDDYVPPCSFGGGEDAVLRWTAAIEGDYVFDTIGSGFDTTLALLTDCPGAGELIACNDDGPGLNFDSQITQHVLAGQTVIIVVDGYDQDVGPFTLNIAAL